MPPVVVRALTLTRVGEVSDVITTQTSFEIVKLLSAEKGTFKAAHIQIQFKDIENTATTNRKSSPTQAVYNC